MEINVKSNCRSREVRVTGAAQLAFVLGTLLSAPLVNAGPFQQSASVSAGAEYDSNPAMVARDEKSVSRAIFTPVYRGNWQRDENRIQAQAQLRVERSSDQALSLDREDPSASVQWTNANPRGELHLQFAYSESSTRVSELDDTGFLFADGTATRQALNAGWNRVLTERTQFGLNAGYSGVSYDVGTLVDHASADLGLSLSHVLSEKTSTFVQVATSRYESDDQSQDTQNTYTMTVGSDWKLSEYLGSGLSIGGVRRDDGTGSSDWNASSHLSFAGERLGTNLAYSRSTTASGAGGYSEADHVSVALSYAASEVTSVGASSQWRENRSLVSNKTGTLGLWANRAISELMSVRLSWSYKKQDATDVAESQSVMMTLQYRLPD